MREFSKSLTDKAYTWYSYLIPNNVSTWEEMHVLFVQKFFLAEDEFTLTQLGREKQRSGEEVVAYIRRFRERSLYVREKARESKLLQICAEGLLPEYICHLINETREGTFSAFLKSARNISLVVRPIPVATPMMFRQSI